MLPLPSDFAAPKHPIGVVARRTGLKPDLIRAWERRYLAIEPIMAAIPAVGIEIDAMTQANGDNHTLNTD